MKIFERLLRMRRERRQRIRDAYIDSLFTLEERAGQMWLLCDGHAVVGFPPDAPSEEMIDTADVARFTAKAYDRFQNVEDAGNSEPQPPVILNVRNNG